jgi:hypothetical protein
MDTLRQLLAVAHRARRHPVASLRTRLCPGDVAITVAGLGSRDTADEFALKTRAKRAVGARRRAGRSSPVTHCGGGVVLKIGQQISVAV